MKPEEKERFEKFMSLHDYMNGQYDSDQGFEQLETKIQVDQFDFGMDFWNGFANWNDLGAEEETQQCADQSRVLSRRPSKCLRTCHRQHQTTLHEQNVSINSLFPKAPLRTSNFDLRTPNLEVRNRLNRIFVSDI